MAQWRCAHDVQARRLRHRISVAIPVSLWGGRLGRDACNAAELPTLEGLIEEAHHFNQSLATPEAQERMAAFMQMGRQTLELELRLTKDLHTLFTPRP